MTTTEASSSLMNYKLKILSSLAAKACSWSGLSSGNDQSHEERRYSASESSTPVEDLRRRDKKAVVKVLQHNGEIYDNLKSKFNGGTL